MYETRCHGTDCARRTARCTHTHTHTSQRNDDITFVLQLRDTRAFATTYVSCIFIDILTDLRERERERKGGGKDTQNGSALLQALCVCSTNCFICDLTCNCSWLQLLVRYSTCTIVKLDCKKNMEKKQKTKNKKCQTKLSHQLY